MNGQQIFDIIYVIIAFNMGIFVVIPALYLTPMGLTHPVVGLQVGLILATAVFFAFALRKNVV